MKVRPSYEPPPDIADLKKWLDDGEGDSVLNAQAILIHQRLKELKAKRRYFGTIQVGDLERELEEFAKVIENIKEHRHDGVLDEYESHIAIHKYM